MINLSVCNMQLLIFSRGFVKKRLFVHYVVHIFKSSLVLYTHLSKTEIPLVNWN